MPSGFAARHLDIGAGQHQYRQRLLLLAQQIDQHLPGPRKRQPPDLQPLRNGRGNAEQAFDGDAVAAVERASAVDRECGVGQE